MTTPTTTRARPGGVTLIVVLAYIAFIFQILTGILVLIESDDRVLHVRTDMTEDQLLASGVILVVIGVIGILLTGALSRGSNIVRILFAVWVALQVAGGLYSIVTHDGVREGSGILPVVLGVIILYLLFNRSAQAFFEGD